MFLLDNLDRVELSLSSCSCFWPPGPPGAPAILCSHCYLRTVDTDEERPQLKLRTGSCGQVEYENCRSEWSRWYRQNNCGDEPGIYRCPELSKYCLHRLRCRRTERPLLRETSNLRGTTNQPSWKSAEVLQSAITFFRASCTMRAHWPAADSPATPTTC
jgi:hypothetical protein